MIYLIKVRRLIKVKREARGFQFFRIILQLSDEGDENVESIVQTVYQYLNTLKSSKPARWVFDELNNLGKISFTFKDKESPINLASSLPADLYIYSFEHITTSSLLNAHYYLTKFDPELIESLNSYLTPERMRLTAVSKKYEGKTGLTEKWYGAEYSIEPLT